MEGCRVTISLLDTGSCSDTDGCDVLFNDGFSRYLVDLEDELSKKTPQHIKQFIKSHEGSPCIASNAIVGIAKEVLASKNKS